MKIMISLLAVLYSIQTPSLPKAKNPVVILISSASTPDYIGEMREYLALYDIVFNVEKEVWAKYDELQEFAFTLTHTDTKQPMSFHFRYNDLNKHQIFIVYPKGDREYGSVMSDLSYLKSDLLPLLVTMDVRKAKPILHRSYDKSGAPYRESIVLKDLEQLEDDLSESIALYKSIKADQALGQSLSGYAYTYNGEYLEDPKGINLLDMSADVLIEDLADDGKIINIWSDEPLDRIVSGSSVAEQR